MAVARLKNWVDREILTHSALNAEFSNIVDNGEDLAWPATKAKDFNGQQLTLDADGDTSIVASTDDIMKFTTAGTEAMRINPSGDIIMGDTSGNANVRLSVWDDGSTATLINCQWTDATATEGPVLGLDRLSSSPAAGDEIGRLHFNGRDDAATVIGYAQAGGIIRDVTAGQVDGVFEIQCNEDSVAKFLRFGPNTANEGAAIFISNTAPQPTTSPVAGGLLYVLAGALRYLGSSGNDNLLAVA